MGTPREDYAAYLKEQEGGEDTPRARYREYLRSQVEDQVSELRRSSAKGPKPPVLTPQAPNPKNEAITGSQSPRLVGLPPGTLETGAEAVGAAGGATAGSLYGLQAGAPFGPLGAAIGGLGGGLIGAGLGLAGTRAAVEGGKAAFGARPPITADEAIASGQRAFLEGMAGEGLFRGIRAIPAGARGLKQRLLAGEIQPAERALYDQAQGMGVHLTPSTLTESKAPKMVESTLRRTLAGSGKFTANDIENELALRRGVDQWADEVLGKYAKPGDDPALALEQYGNVVQKALKNEVIPEQREMVKALYKNLDDQTQGAKIVDTTDLYKELLDVRASLVKRGDAAKGYLATLDNVLEKISKKGPVTGLTVERETQKLETTIPGTTNVDITKSVVPGLKSEERGTKPYDKGFVTPDKKQLEGIFTNREYQKIPAGERMTGLKVTEKSDAPRQPVSLTFSEAQEIRSIIGSEIGHGGPALPAHDMQKLKKSYSLMTEQMGKAAIDFTKATGKDINLSWLLADTMNKRGKELFNESVVAKAVEKDPEAVVKTVFQKDAFGKTRDLVRALDTKPEALGAYRRGVVETLIQEATDQSTGRVVGTNFAKAARKRGEGVLKETFGENYAGFKQILEVAERMPKQSESGMLWFEQGLFIRGAITALPLVGAVAGHMADSPALIAASVGAPVGWMLATNRLSRILTDKELTNKLLSVQHMRPGTEAFGRVMTQLGAVEIGETGRPVEGTPEPRRGLLTGIGQKLME